MTRETDFETQLPTNRAFVVQFKSGPADSEDGLEGRIEHIATGNANYFASAEELCRILRSSLREQQDEKGGH
jgi:hypothetical protein